MILFKHKKDVVLFSALHPILIMIFADMWNYAYEKHGILLTVTETITTAKQDEVLKRKSKSHQRKIALDIRTKDINPLIVEDIIKYITDKEIYKKYHYLSGSGVYRLCYWHVGNAEHIHMAIHSKFAIK